MTLDHFLYPGFAKLGHDPGRVFLEVFVDACLASKLQGFKSQELANVISGEYACLAPIHAVLHLQIAIRDLLSHVSTRAGLL
jgi:hypothetical protein